MNGILSNTAETHVIAPGDLHELVRGQEQCLLEQIGPVVRAAERHARPAARGAHRRRGHCSADLALRHRQRARDTNSPFPMHQPRVTEILALVGLDRFLAIS